MHLPHLPHGCLILRGNELHRTGVAQKFFLVYLRHAGHLWVLPLRRVFLVEQHFGFLSEGRIHLLVFFVKLK